MSEIEDFEAIATSISYAMLNMFDEDVHKFIAEMHSIDDVWVLACEIVANGPRNDMERRILGEALVRRLEGK